MPSSLRFARSVGPGEPRWRGSRFAFFFLVPLAIAASCGGKLGADGDAGSDASGACGGCPMNYTCQYPISEGCSATPKCMPQVACKGLPSCACDGTTTQTCGQGATKPIAHGGPCNPQPPPDGCTIACETCDTTAFTVTPQVAPSEATKACTPGDISSFVTACLGSSATQTTCSTWEQSDAGTSSCGACVLTPISAATWGPIVCQSSSCTINAGGCIDIVSGQVPIENGTTGSCGDLTNASDQCLDYACSACTTTSDSDACTQHAQQNECKSYFDAASTSSTCALVDAGASTCSPQSDADWASFINVFCGTGP